MHICATIEVEGQYFDNYLCFDVKCCPKNEGGGKRNEKNQQ